MSQEWLAPHGELYYQIAATRVDQTMKFGRCVEERMAVAGADPSRKALLALEG
jgi:hypothetical protein